MLRRRAVSPRLVSWSSDILTGSPLSTRTRSASSIPATERVNVGEPVEWLVRQRPRTLRAPAFGAVVRLAARIRPIQLIGQRSAIAVENRPREAEQQRALGLGHQLATQQIGAARLVFPPTPRAVLEEMLQLLV